MELEGLNIIENADELDNMIYERSVQLGKANKPLLTQGFIDFISGVPSVNIIQQFGVQANQGIALDQAYFLVQLDVGLTSTTTTASANFFAEQIMKMIS